MPPEVPEQVVGVVGVVEALLARSGPPVLVGVDGRSGSGKTELAASLAAALADAGRHCVVVHLDDLYPGWAGLAAGLTVLCDRVVAPLRAGRVAAYPSWDWDAGAPGPHRTVPAAPVVLLEGVGVLASGCADLLDVRVWLEAPTEVRRARALARDGGSFAPWWTLWADQEDELLGGHRPTADLVLDTDTGAATWVRLDP